MNRYGKSGFVGGASSSNRASATTVCQKCLKKGHYSYDCKSQAQERPYISRPSRSQQLLNPKLKPKLANIAPTPSEQDKAAATQKTAYEALDRPRKHSLDDMDDHRPSRKRSRSVSSFSSASVSTISTRSPSPDRSRRLPNTNRSHPSRRERENSVSEGAGDKRRRRSSSVISPDRAQSFQVQGRNTRMRRNSRSPSERGRRRSRSANTERRVRSASGKNMSKDAHGLKSIRRPGSNDRAVLDRHAAVNRPGYNNSRDQDREMSDVPECRPRSLSPFSKRVALTQSMAR